MNSFNAVGRLTKDPEGATTSNGKVYVRFSIAVDRGYKGADGNRIVDFIPCVAWDPTASLITRYFHKGDLIGISGRLETNKVEDNGKSTTYYSILVYNIDFIQGKKETTPDNKPQPAPQPAPTPIEDMVKDYELPNMDDVEGDLPFDV